MQGLLSEHMDILENFQASTVKSPESPNGNPEQTRALRLCRTPQCGQPGADVIHQLSKKSTALQRG